MGAITAFEQLLETDEVAGEAVHHIPNTFRSNKRIERLCYGRFVSEARAGRWRQAEVPTKAVWGGIQQLEVGSKGPGCDLEVILRVTPSAETRLRVRIKDG